MQAGTVTVGVRPSHYRLMPDMPARAAPPQPQLAPRRAGPAPAILPALASIPKQAVTALAATGIASLLLMGTLEAASPAEIPGAQNSGYCTVEALNQYQDFAQCVQFRPELNGGINEYAMDVGEWSDSGLDERGRVMAAAEAEATSGAISSPGAPLDDGYYSEPYFGGADDLPGMC